MTTEPTALGFIAAVTMPPTAISLRPAFAAASRLTSTAMYGWVTERLLSTWATWSSLLTSLTMADDAARRSASLLAVTLIAMSDDANPEPDAARVISPASLIFATSSRTVFCSLTWSTSGSVVSEKLALPLPLNAERSELPLDPRVSCTVSTPVVPTSTFSSFLAASSRTSRLVPSGRVWLTVSVFWPLSPMKFVFSSGAAAPVPMSTSRATRIVTAGRLRVKLMTGRYARWRRLGLASSSSSLAGFLPVVFDPRNQ